MGMNCSISKNKRTSECKTRPKPILPYWGGKAKVADKIISKFPEHRTYVETFAGGGSVYWANNIPDNFVINDLDKDIYHLYKTAKNSPDSIKKCDFNGMTKGKFNRIKEKNNKSSCDIINLHKHSFGGSPTNGFAEKHKNFHNRFNEEHTKKLNKTRVMNENFEKIAKEYDKEEVLQYWDPPYVKGGNAYKTHGVSPEQVCKVAKDLKKAKVVISYDINADVKKACKGLKFSHIKLPYLAGNNKHIKTEYLIKNF